ncbi:MAG: cation transporting ATPase C-terminal domain-containing protein, partial [Syntrophomonadaceae bacterium]
ITIANDTVDDELLERSHRWDIRFIRNFMFTFGLISSFFDYLTFAVLFLGFHVQETAFQSGWFVFSILTELLILMVMRTRRPFYRSRPAPILLYSTIVVAIITIFLPYLPLHQLLSIEPLPPGIIVSLLAIVGLYILATEIIKHYFFRRHPD